SQYVEWLGELGRGDFGTSIISGRPVMSDLKQRMPVTAQLGVMALVLSVIIAIPLGVLSAVKQDTIWDYGARGLAIAALSIPSFWLALLVITYGFRWFSWTPPLRYENVWEDPVSNL